MKKSCWPPIRLSRDLHRGLHVRPPSSDETAGTRSIALAYQLEPDKTEVIFFGNSHVAHPRPGRWTCAGPSTGSTRPTQYRIAASPGKDYVHTMTSRARSTLKALQPLLVGNSIRSLTWASCRLVYKFTQRPYDSPAREATLKTSAWLKTRQCATSLASSAPPLRGPYTTNGDPAHRPPPPTLDQKRVSCLYQLPPNSQLAARVSGP